MQKRLEGKRVLLTQPHDYMGPAISRLFTTEGAEIISPEMDLTDTETVTKTVASAGDVDVLVANLALKSQQMEVDMITDTAWLSYFEALVHPLMRVTRAVVPQMKHRRTGKIVAITSAAPLRGFGRLPNLAAYCAARGAQNAFVRAAGLELAEYNIQVNAIAQNYVKNPTFYPDELIETAEFKTHMEQVLPSKRLAEAEESAELALFLASEKSNFMVGQVIPFAGGWVTTTG